jgi:hypothetical protein
MGWASGDLVFDPVAKKLIELRAPDDVRREVCSVLIAALQNRGWDTEGESLGEFAGDPAIVAAFRKNDIVQACANEDGPNWDGCGLEPDHAGDHDDGYGHTWPRTGGDNA